jgi:hypothetical protein
MDIKKTDVFGGIGVLVIQLIINAIVYAFQKNNINLVIGIIFAVVLSIFIVTVWILRRKIKKQNESHAHLSSSWEAEKNDLIEKNKLLIEKSEDTEHERDEIAQDLEIVEQDLELYNNQCAYYANTQTINKKILYSLKHNKKCDVGELQSLISEIEYIFRDDVFSKNAKINTSIFSKNASNLYSILLSTKHSLGTIDKLKLDNSSLVGVAFNEKRVIYCGDIDNRKPDIPFVELDAGRQYKSILAIPLVIDDTTEFVMVITCTNINCLEETYNKYREVIHRYLELLGVLLFISSNKEEAK